MDPTLLYSLIGAGVGGLKGMTVDRWREDKDRQLAAETQRYSPWTGLQAQPIKRADPLGSAMQGGATGLELGQNQGRHDLMKTLFQQPKQYTSEGFAPQGNGGMQSLYAALLAGRG